MPLLTSSALWAAAMLAAAPSEGLTVIGFSADGRRFGAVVAPAGEQTGVLWQWDLASGKPLAEKPAMALAVAIPSGTQPSTWGSPVLKAGGLGGDPGRERYRSGSATATKFELNGAPLEVALEAPSGKPAQVVVRRGTCARALPLEADGADANLSSVLSSGDGSGLAIVTKALSGGVRRFRIAVVRLDGPLGAPACLASAKSLRVNDAACLASLKKLTGTWTGAALTTGDAESYEETMANSKRAPTPLHSFTVEERNGRPWVSLPESSMRAMVEEGEVIGCESSSGKLRLTTSDEGREPGVLVLTPLRNGALQIVHESCWPIGPECSKPVDTFRRD